MHRNGTLRRARRTPCIFDSSAKEKKKLVKNWFIIFFLFEVNNNNNNLLSIKFNFFSQSLDHYNWMSLQCTILIRTNSMRVYLLINIVLVTYIFPPTYICLFIFAQHLMHQSVQNCCILFLSLGLRKHKDKVIMRERRPPVSCVTSTLLKQI